MENIENINKYTISKHCMERYAERIMDKDSNNDIYSFIYANESKIQNDINKLIQYGELIYSGKQNKKDAKNPNAVVDVYLNGCWVIIVDNKARNCITLYKIDLGLDDEFNKLYISKMMEKLNQSREMFENVRLQVQTESNMYKEMIEDSENQIKEYKSMIKNLEELCSGYRAIIDNNHVRISQANKEVAEILNQMIGKKEF